MEYKCRNSPCKGCEHRFATCHTVCKDYKDWKAEKEHFKESYRLKRNADMAIVDSKAKFFNKLAKMRRIGNHFKPKRHFLFERCAKCGKRLKHYHWFWGEGDFMGCEVDYNGNTEWFCEDCENEMNKIVLHKIPTANHCSQLLCHFIRNDGECQKPDGEICPLSNIAENIRSDQNA